MAGRTSSPPSSAHKTTRRSRHAPLSAVSSTLRIPLAARALGDARFPEVAVGDVHAAPALAALDDDGTQWLDDDACVYGCLARTRRFRALAQDYLAERPHGHVVNLGCGLTHYFQWLDNGRARLTDADLPEVLALRHALLPPPGGRHAQRALDLGDARWWDTLGLPAQRDGEPPLLFSEGVLMYLQPETVRQVLATFGERAPAGALYAFDAMCWLAAGHARLHPLVRHTQAQFHWGLYRLANLTAPHRRLRLAAIHPVMEDYDWHQALLGPVFRTLMDVPHYAIYVLQVADDEENAS